MKRYGKQNDGFDDGDTLSNCNNAVKSSIHRTDGKGALRSSKQKRMYRTIMNKRKRAEYKYFDNLNIKDYYSDKI